MAARLRVPAYALHPHARSASNRHDQEEGYVIGICRHTRRDANEGGIASYLEPLKGGKVPVEILIRGKDAEENKKQFQACLDTLKKAGKKVAVLKKDSSTGAFAEEWKAAFGEAGFKDEDQVDLGLLLSNAALSVKDEKELVRLRNSF
jgi:nucleosome binding factor SPN SPT16 subunit